MDVDELKRVFIAIDFPDSVIKEVARLQGLLGNIRFVGKMTELENLHITLKFLGEIDDKKLAEVEKRLKEIKFVEMKLKLGKLGTFSTMGNPNIVWVKIDGKELYDLQKQIDLALSGLFVSEEKFMGHLTIARVKHVPDKMRFKEHLSAIHVKQIEFEVSEIKLKRSELMGLGPIYSDIITVKSEH